jgi:undecaprenyl-diphosphatase
VRIIGGFVSSVRDRSVDTDDQKLAWMIILATIPVGIVGLKFEHAFRVIFGKPVVAGIFLAANGLILIAGERYRSRASVAGDLAVAAERDPAELIEAARPSAGAAGRVSAGGQSLRQREQAGTVQADRRLASMSYPQAVVVGSAQTLALLAGISRDGVTMVAGMMSGLSREDAARFAFLLATPVILAAGALKIPDLLGPLGSGIRGQIVVGSALSGMGAYLSVRFLLRYLRTRTLTLFGVYCLIAGLASVAYIGLVR